MDELEVIDGPLEHQGATGRPSRWTLVVLAVAAAIVGFGYAGRQSDGPAGRPGDTAMGITGSVAPARGLSLERPRDGDAVSGTVFVRGVAEQRLGRVRVAALVGSTELGAVATTLDEAGPFAIGVPLMELAWPMTIELRITSIGGDGAPLKLASRMLVAGPRQGAGLTSISAEPAGDRLRLEVRGWIGADAAALALSLRSAPGPAPGAEIAATRPRIGPTEGWGGALLGSRAFEARLETAAMAPGTPVYLVLTWQDPRSGGVASAVQPLSVPQPAGPADR